MTSSAIWMIICIKARIHKMHPENEHASDELCMRTNVMFRVIGKDLVPDEITGLLDLRPTVAHARGEMHKVPRVGIRPWSNGHWSLCTEKLVASRSVEDHVRFLLDQLEVRTEEVRQILDDHRHRVSISFWWESTVEHGSFELPSSLFERLSHLCDDMEFHFIGTCHAEYSARGGRA